VSESIDYEQFIQDEIEITVDDKSLKATGIINKYTDALNEFWNNLVTDPEKTDFINTLQSSSKKTRK